MPKQIASFKGTKRELNIILNAPTPKPLNELLIIDIWKDLENELAFV